MTEATERHLSVVAPLRTERRHVNPNRVEAAYMRSDLFDRRRHLMETWSDYLLPIR